MSLVFNIVGGGGGKLKDIDAVLIVTVPTGSTVTMTKGGVTFTPTMWVQAADPTLDCALFVISPSLFDSQNAWTVTATLGTGTASDTVTIDSNEQYSLELSSYHVPPEYQEVEYIVFPAGAYINTGLNANLGVFTEIKVSETNYVNDAHYIGCSVNDGNTYHVTAYSNKYYWGRGSGETSGGTWSSGEKVVQYNNAAENYAMKVNGTVLGSGTAAPTPNLTIRMGARNTATFAGNIYYCFMTINSTNTLARELYPCYRKSDSVVGFWDKIGKTFYTNAGSKTLVAGPDVN